MIVILCDAASFAAALAVGPLSFIEHSRSIRPSAALELYLLVTLVLDAIQIWGFPLGANASPVVYIALVEVCLKLVLFVLEAQDKRAILREPWRHLSPETIAGTINRTFIWWINPLIIKGYRTLLSNDDLPPLEGELSSGPLRVAFQRAWDQCMCQIKTLKAALLTSCSATPKTTKSLLFALLPCVWSTFLSVIPPRLMLVFFRYAQPLLISRTISFLEQPVAVGEELNPRYQIILAAAVIYVGMAVRLWTICYGGSPN